MAVRKFWPRKILRDIFCLISVDNKFKEVFIYIKYNSIYIN